MHIRNHHRALTAVSVGVLSLALSACGNTPAPGATSATDAAKTAASTAASKAGEAITPNGKTYKGAGLEITDTWVKAMPDLATGTMTGIFGKIKNTSDKPIVILSGSQDLSAVTELHETVMIDGAMKMRPIEGGYTVPAGGSFELKPGGNHVMVMNMTKPLKAGDTVKVTLVAKDGGKLEFEAVAWPYVKGGNEPYVSKTGAAPMTSTSS